MSLGTKIQKLRKSQNLSQEAFADIMKVSRQSISKWELDQACPEINKLIEITDYFGITLDELVRDSSEEKVVNNIDEAILLKDNHFDNDNSNSATVRNDEFVLYKNDNKNPIKGNSFQSRQVKVVLMLLLFITFFIYGYYSGSYVTFVTYVSTIFVVTCFKTLKKSSTMPEE